MKSRSRLSFYFALLGCLVGIAACTSSTGRPLRRTDAAVDRTNSVADDATTDDAATDASTSEEAGSNDLPVEADAAGADGDAPGATGGVDGTGQDIPGVDGSSSGDSRDTLGAQYEAGVTLPGPATCDDTKATRPTVFFRVPRATDSPSNTDFYRLPFPNDIRIRNGRLSLAGHPRPGPTILPFDIVDRYLGAIEADSTGFGTNQAVYFRFSHDPNFDSLKQEGAVTLIDITAGSPDYGRRRGLGWYSTTGGSPYICNRYIAIRPPFGEPLRPGTTYAAVLGKGIRGADGNAFEQDDDFRAMLAAAAPTDPDLGHAWAAYAPLRKYLADANASYKLAASDLVAVAVFTTEDVERSLAAVDAAIAAAPMPAARNFVRCGDPGIVSPCDDGKAGAAHQRGCFPGQANPAFDEYQGTMELPIFQEGTAPYSQPEDGGGILPDASGKVAAVRQEQVCVSLAVPKGAAPAAGWPVVVYSHGTGGNYRSAITQGLAADYAAGTATGGAPVPMVTLGYDGVLHGPRSGGSTTSTDQLVYNFYNPRAARDNNLQAAADLLAIARAVAGWNAAGIKLDPSHVALYGHSQGGNAAALAAARGSPYRLAVMSGTGGTLMLSLLGKTQPVNLAFVLPLMLADPTVDANHPVLNLIQMYCDRSDPVNFARRLVREPVAGAVARHLVHVYGTGDTFAPVETQRRYAQAAGLQVVSPLVDTYPTTSEYGMATTASPVSANQAFGSLGSITAAQAQYAPNGYDGHFVSTGNLAARQMIRKFLVTFVRDTSPIIEL